MWVECKILSHFMRIQIESWQFVPWLTAHRGISRLWMKRDEVFKLKSFTAKVIFFICSGNLKENFSQKIHSKNRFLLFAHIHLLCHVFDWMMNFMNFCEFYEFRWISVNFTVPKCLIIWANFQMNSTAEFIRIHENSSHFFCMKPLKRNKISWSVCQNVYIRAVILQYSCTG